MPPEAEAPESGALSIEAAIAAFDAMPDDEDQGAAPPADAAAAPPADPSQPSEGAASAPDDAAASGAEPPAAEGEEGAAAEGAENPLEAPLYWSPEAKAKFAALDPALQAEILAQEGPREQASAKAKDEAKAVRERAEAEIAGIVKFAEQVGQFLPQAIQTFRSRWGDNPDWVAYAQEHGAQAMSLAKAQYEAEIAQLQQVAKAATQAEAVAQQAYVATEFKTLEKIAPHLAHPETGAAKRGEITKYLVDAGVPKESIRGISALEMVLAEKAMRWDASQKSSLTPPPKPAPKTPSLARGGGAAAGPADPKAQAASTAKNRFVQTKSVDDAVRLLDSLED